MENATSTSSIDDHGICFVDEGAVYYSMIVFIAFFIVCINCGVIFTMATNSYLRTKRNAFLASLAASDLLNGLVAIPLHILCSCYHKSLGRLCLAQAICFRFIAVSTMLNIFMITIERYIGINYPIKYTIILTKPRTVILLSCTWATSLSSALVSYSWLVGSNAGDAVATEEAMRMEHGYFIFSFIAFFFLPLVIMIVLYFRMFRTISKARRSASKARMYLKSVLIEYPQSPALRRPSPMQRQERSGSQGCGHLATKNKGLHSRPPSRQMLVEGRNCSLTVGSYGEGSTTKVSQDFQSRSPIPRSPMEGRKRTCSRGSYGDYLTVKERSGCHSSSPVLRSPMEKKERSRSQGSYSDQLATEHQGLDSRPPSRQRLVEGRNRSSTVGSCDEVSTNKEFQDIRSRSPIPRSLMDRQKRSCIHGSCGNYFAVKELHSPSTSLQNPMASIKEDRRPSLQHKRSTPSLLTGSKSLFTEPDVDLCPSGLTSGDFGSNFLKKFDKDASLFCLRGKQTPEKSKASLMRRMSDVCGSASNRLREVRKRSYEERLRNSRVAGEYRVLVIFVTMLSVFVFCWLSWYIMLLGFALMIDIPVAVLDCFDILRFSVCFFNPILYTFLKKDFRIAFLNSFRGSRKRQKRKTVMKC